MNFKALIAAAVCAVALSSFSTPSQAQATSSSNCSNVATSTNTGNVSNVTEDFTCHVSSQQWFFYNGACLTAGTAADTPSTPVNPGTVPGCVRVMNSYYKVAGAGGTLKNADAALVGGENGYLGSSGAPSDPTQVVADDNGSGALRFTNGAPYGKQERGAIVSNYTFGTGAGIHITFKTLAYLGSADGPYNDGADGLSFFLLDGCLPVAGGTLPSGCPTNTIYGTNQTFVPIGATGGSLAYSCSNNNAPFDGLVGAYIGLGMDEWGNFLNGTSNSLGEKGSTINSGDNTATGGGYQSGRIGLRGAGSISWAALNNAYGNNTGSSNPYYPSSLATCTTGTFYNNSCGSCSGGTFSAGACTGTGALSCGSGTLSGSNCLSCPSGYALSPDGSTCYSTSCPQHYVFAASTDLCATCLDGSNNPHGSWVTNSGTACNSGNGGNYSTQAITTTSTPTSTAATQVNPTYSYPPSVYAVQNTCSTGKLYNYSNANSPVAVGPADLTNSVNTAKIMDYAAVYYSVIPTPTQDSVNGFLIANETAGTRSVAQPILYDLKITADGLLSLSYSYNGGTTVPVISNQQIEGATGPFGTLPKAFRFGFAGSTGGSTNVHEILCFKASPYENSSSSGAINVYENPFIHQGTQIYIANYFPSDWTGQLEAIGISASTGTPAVMKTQWDARCVLSGVDPATNLCDATGLATPTSGQGSGNRVMLTWDPATQKGEPFEWPGTTAAANGNITAVQQATLTKGDASSTSNRLDYLRGVTTNEITASGSGFYRARNSILGDIVDSSPTWIGPPQNPYTLVSSWTDRLYQTQTQPENATGAQKYADYMSKSGALPRENVVYAGANDGFLHGFRAGALDVNGNLDTSTYSNDGKEVLAYMPSVVLNSIHPVDTTGAVIAQLDYSNTQYSHNWYVDATPSQGDIFYGLKWHTWVVSGLGPGGSAIFALDVTDPTQFSEANASTLVKGEWSTNIATAATTSGTNGTTTVVAGNTSTTTIIKNSTQTTITSNLTCSQQTVVACGVNLGNTFGAPQIRRFHSGQWGFVFGNGYSSYYGSSGIYIALLDGSTGAPTFYWFPTKLTFSSSTPNGISYVWAADLDLDNTVDYIYAGDLLGNLWRFDVTDKSPANWGVSASSPLYNAGQPITTQPIVSTLKTITWLQNAVGLDIDTAPERVVVNFGTGRQIPQTLNSGTVYASGIQSIYGIWDWDMGTPTAADGTGGSGWNKLSPKQQGIGLTSAPNTPLTTSNLVQQTLTETPTTTTGGVTTTGTATLTKNPICWAGTTTCSDGLTTNSSKTDMGWYTVLPSTNEQIIFNPLADPTTGAIVFNTYIPAANSPLSCTQNGATGFSIGMDPGTGNALPLRLFEVGGAAYDGVQTNAAGTASVINAGEAGGGKNYLVTHNASGTISFNQLNFYNVTGGQRVYWIQKR